MRSSHSLLAAGCVVLGVVAIVLALVASVARATILPQTAPTTGVPALAATSVAIAPTTGAPPLALGMNAAGASALPGSHIVFELSLGGAGSSGQIQTRTFISGPADVIDVQATNGSCSTANPVVCHWSLATGSASARIVARVAPDAATGTTISAQSLAHTALSSAASGISSLQVSAPISATIAQAATATAATPVAKEGAQASATVLPPTIAPPTPTQPAATATTAPTGTTTPAATETPTPMPAATQAPTLMPTPETATLTGTLPETGTLPASPIVALELAGCALLFVGVRRIRAADRALSAQQAAVRKLGTLVSAIGYVQRRTRIAADDMADNGEALVQKLENRTRR